MIELIHILITIYMLCSGLLLLYGMNCYVMIILFFLGRKNAAKKREQTLEKFDYSLCNFQLPKVTTQIAVYNEMNVVERIIRAACNIQYPKGRHEIQVLDDSNDETCEITDRLVTELAGQGNDIRVIRRNDRTGFKAGALAGGLKTAKGELIAVFDSDFVPPSDFLMRSVPFFLGDEKLGLVQARWGHLNRCRSLLTRAQSIGIDGHFMIEQSARNWNGLFMNFNGTAGIWRHQAIKEGGGWH